MGKTILRARHTCNVGLVSAPAESSPTAQAQLDHHAPQAHHRPIRPQRYRLILSLGWPHGRRGTAPRAVSSVLGRGRRFGGCWAIEFTLSAWCVAALRPRRSCHASSLVWFPSRRVRRVYHALS